MSVCAAFGPNESYLFFSPNYISKSNLPKALDDLFTGPHAVQAVHELALGPDGSFFISFTNLQGQKGLFRQGLPANLDKWLVPIEGQGVGRDLSSLQVSLGPNGSYFAYDKDGATWANLPAEFENAVRAARDANGAFLSGKLPSCVSFGPDGSFVYIDQLGGGVWSSNLQQQAPSLWEFFRSHPPGPMQFCCILCCTGHGRYLIVGLDGNCDARIPESFHAAYVNFATDWKIAMASDALPQTQPEIPQQQQQQQQQQQPPISHTQSYAGPDRSAHVPPLTHAQSYPPAVQTQAPVHTTSASPIQILQPTPLHVQTNGYAAPTLQVQSPVSYVSSAPQGPQLGMTIPGATIPQAHRHSIAQPYPQQMVQSPPHSVFPGYPLTHAQTQPLPAPNYPMAQQPVSTPYAPQIHTYGSPPAPPQTYPGAVPMAMPGVAGVVPPAVSHVIPQAIPQVQTMPSAAAPQQQLRPPQQGAQQPGPVAARPPQQSSAAAQAQANALAQKNKIQNKQLAVAGVKLLTSG